MEKFMQKYLTDDQMARISQVVAEAEKETSGEIVPMIVSRSSTTGHIPYYAGFIILSILLLVFHSWQPWWLHEWSGAPVVGIFLVSFLLGFLVSQFQFVQRFLTPDEDQEMQVWLRAQSEWAQNKLHKTRDRTGILIFVSIMERKAVVLADEGIAKHYNPETWKEVVDQLGQHLHKNEWVLGFEKAVRRCGEVLKAYLPAGEDNPNEIPDQLIIKL